jgi:hypothetical protein
MTDVTPLPRAVAKLRAEAMSRLSDSVTVSVVTRQTYSKLTQTSTVMLAIARAKVGAIVLLIDQEEFGLEAQLELLGDLGFRPDTKSALERARASIGAS